MILKPVKHIKDVTRIISLRLITFITLLIFSSKLLLAQPSWVSGTPSVGTTGPLSIPVNFGITQAGTVYIIIFNINNSGITSGYVKSAAHNHLISGNIVATAEIAVSAANANKILSATLDVINASTTHSVWIVAENSSGQLQANPVKLQATTTSCPSITFLNQLLQPVKCVNQGATAIFDVVPNANPLFSGILKGTTWSLDWGDGTVVTYTSASDNDIPTLAMRTHTYTTVTNCNFIFSCGVKNPCGMTYSPQYVAVVHGRDIASDGDGYLRLVNNTGGSTTINICEGTQTTITVRDNSRWNCQNPTLPTGFTAQPNTDPREIEWLYGRNPAGTKTSTITGDVTVASLGIAPQTSGRISPNPYGPSSLAQAVTIPATCKAGEYFRIYLKNWNKCNWADPDYISTYIDINVVAAPKAPTVPDRTVCLSDSRTLSVTSTPVGTIRWYSDQTLTNLVRTGTTYTPNFPNPGSISFWVTDQSTTGLKCVSPATKVTLTVREALNQPGTISGPASTCPNTSGLTFSLADDPPSMTYGGATEYVWSVPSGLSISAQGTKSITVNVGSTTGNKTISVYLRYTSTPNCSSGTSSTDLTVYSTANNAGAITANNICADGMVNVTNKTSAFTGSPASSGPDYSWERAPGPLYTSWTALSGSSASFSETLSTPGTYRYRRTATFGCGNKVFTTCDVTVYSKNHNAGSISGLTICAGSTETISSITAASTGTPASSGPVYSWERAPGPAFSSWTTLSGSSASFSETMNIAGTYRYRRTATFGCGNPVSTTTDVTVNPVPTPSVAGLNNVCAGVKGITYQTVNVTGNTYSWTVTGGTIAGGAGTSSITVDWGAAGNGTVKVTETIPATGCNVTTPDYPVTINPGSPNSAPSVVSFPGDICRNGTLNIDVSDVSTAASYIWDYSWVAGTNDQTTSSSQVSVDLTGLAPGTYSVRVAAANGCGTGPWMAARSFDINDIPDLSSLGNTVCSDNASGITLSIDNAGTYCSGITYNITAINKGGLTASAGSPVVANGRPANELSDDAWTNKTGSNVNVVYTVVPISTEGCAGNPETVTLVVQPEPVLASLNTSRCNNAPLNFNLDVPAGSTPAANYNITSINSNGLSASAGSPSTGNGLTADVISDDAWTNSSASPVNVVYKVVPVGTNGCTGDEYTVTVTINPEPSLATLDVIRCSDQSLAFNLSVASGSVGALNYNIISINSNGLTASAGSPAAGNGLPSNVISDDAWTNTTGALVNVVYTIVPVSSAGCLGSAKTVTIGVRPEPVLATLDRPKCSDEALGFNLSVATGSIAASTYNITSISNGGLTYSAGNPVTGTGFAANVISDDAWTNKTTAPVDVTYTVVPVSGNGCKGDPKTIIVTINPEPSLATLSAVKCSEEASGINLAVASGSIAASSFNITAINSGGLTASSGSPGTGTGLAANVIADDAWRNLTAGPVDVVYTIVPVSSSLCLGDAKTVTITVNPKPVINNLNSSVCSGGTFNLMPLHGTDGVVPTGTTYTWSDPVITPSGAISGGSAQSMAQTRISQTLVNTTNSAAQAQYTVTPVAGSCSGSPFTVTVTVNPLPAINDLTRTICSGETFNVVPLNGTDGIVPSGISYTWTTPVVTPAGTLTGTSGQSSGQPGISQTLTNTTNSPATAEYIITPTSGTCTGNTFNLKITVNPRPAINNLEITVCSGSNFTIIPQNITNGIVPAGTSYTWSSPAVTGNMTGGSGSSGSPLNISGNLTNPTNFEQTATYQVTPSSGICTGTQFTITVKVSPVPSINPISTSVCTGIQFSVAPSDPANGVIPVGTTYSWGLPDVTGGMTGRASGSGASVITGTLNNGTDQPQTATYTVTPKSGTCSGSPFNVTVTVNPKPVIILMEKTVCSEESFSVIPVDGVNGIIPSGTTYSWAPPSVTGGMTGGESSSGAPSAITGKLKNTTNLPQKATYSVTPLSGSCPGDPFSVVVTVNPLPVTSDISGEPIICETATNRVYQVINTPNSSYFWTVPASLRIRSPQGLYFIIVDAVPGMALPGDKITVTETFPSTGCVGITKEFPVIVSPSKLGESIIGPTSVCKGSTGNRYSVSVTTGSTYSWSLPSGAFITSNPSLHEVFVTFPLDISGQVSVIETNGACTTFHLPLPVTINPLPAPTISGTASVCIGSKGNSYTTEPGMSNYIWSVSAGGTITGGAGTNSITVDWGTAGAQTVSVNYTNSNGCTASTPTIHPVSVYPLPVPAITGPSGACVNSTGNTYTTESGMTNYQWTISSGGIVTAGGTTGNNSITITWTTAGAQSVRVNYTNGNGCTGATEAVYPVTVHTLPVPVITGNTTACVNSAGNVYRTDAGMSNYIWSVSSGGVITAGGTGNDEVTVTWTTAGARTVSVNYTDVNGCSAAGPTVYPVTVNILPVPVITGPASVCIGSSGNEYRTESGMSNYVWSVSPGGTITGGTGTNIITVSWNTTGSQTVSVNYTNGNGCTATAPATYIVNVNPLPVPTVTGPSAVCRNSSGNTYRTESGMTNYQWTVSAGGTVTAGGTTSDNTVTVTWNTTGSRSVSVIYTNGNGCTASVPSVYPVTVNDLPVPSITGPTPVCRNTSGNQYITEPGMGNYVWSVSSGGIITAGGTGNNTVTVLWTTSGPQTVSVNYTNGNGCSGSSATVYNVMVDALPVPAITGNNSACVNSTGNIYSTETGMSNYVWSISPGGTITAGGTGTDNSVTVRWNNVGIQTVSVNYTDGNGCTAASETIHNVSVNPLPTPTISGPGAVCEGTAGNIYTTESGMSGYVWNVSAGGVITSGGTSASNSVTVSWNSAGSQSVSVNYTNGNGCTAASAAVRNVTVNPLPVPTITGPATACQGSAGNVYTTEIGMANYIWTVSPGGTITAGGTTSNNVVIVTWNTTGPQRVSVIYTNGNGCTAAAAAEYNVTVNTLPVPAITGPATVCSGTTGNEYRTESGMTNYQWVVSPGGTITSGGGTNDNSVTVTWTSPGGHTVSVNYTNSNGCRASTPAEYNVTVNPLPVPSISGPAAACVNSAGNLYTTEAGMSNYTWTVPAGGTITSGGTSSDNSVTVTWTTTGVKTVRVIYTNANGCTSSISGSFNTIVNPLPVPTITGPAAACANSAGHVYYSEPGMSNYIWSVSAGGTITGGAGTNSITVDWGTAGAQTVSVNYTNSNGCTASTPTIHPVSVYPLPVPAITGPSGACVNSTGNTYTTESGMTNYQWTISSGGIVTAGGTTGNNSITITWTTAGAQSVRVNYTNGNGCTGATEAVYPVTVHTLPVPVITGNTTACVNSAGNVYRTDAGMSNYIWSVSSGGVITAGGTGNDEVTVTWTTAGARTVSVNYTDVNGCSAAGPTVYPVTVNILPVPVITGPASVCIGSSGNEYRTESGMSNYVWSVSPGGTITGGTGTNIITVSWNTTGSQTVSVNYTNGNGCTATAPATYIVNVNPLPVPTVTGPSAVCRNSSGNTYRTESGMTNYQWTVSAGGTVTAGGTTSDNTVTVTWNTTGSRSVSVIYTNGNGCTASVPSVYPVTVNDLPVPSITGPTPVCRNTSGNQYITEPGMGNYVWSVSSGGIITAGGTGNNTVTVLWTTSGPQTVSVNYTNGNGCSGSSATVYNVMVDALPVPAITGNNSACVNSTGNIYSTETGMSNYVWSISPGGTITAGGTGTDNSVTVRWNNVGIQTVSVNYTDGNGCTAASETIHNVSVNPLPTPTISGPGAVCEGTAGNIYTTESGMSGYVWNVSAGGVITSGGTSASNSVTVSWNSAGSQSVSVNYTNGNGCTAASAAVRNVTVNPLPVPTITGPATACQGSAGNVYTTEIGMANYIWTVSPGGTITAGGTTSNNVVIVTWNTTGPQRVSVIYTNGNGCTAAAAAEYNVTVNTLPVPAITGPATVCSGTTGNEYRTESGMTNYQWVVSPGGTITSGGGTNDNSVTVTWTSPGGHTVSVNYTNSNGCRASTPAEYNVTVNPLPVAILTGGGTICPAGVSNLAVNISMGTGPFDIDINNYPGTTINGYNSGTDIPVSPAALTTYTLLRLRDANGCQVTGLPNLSGSATVTVREMPAINSPLPDQETCEYGMVTFNVFADGDDLTYQWYVDRKDGNGFVQVRDEGIYFGATMSTLSLFGATRDMKGYVYHVVITGCSKDVVSNDATLTVNTIPEITEQPEEKTVCSTGSTTFIVGATGAGLKYRWQVNRGGNAGFTDIYDDAINFSGSLTETLSVSNIPFSFNNYLFRVIVSGDCGVPVQSNIVTLRVNVPPKITLDPVSKPVCDGSGPVYFRANGTGMIDSLRWQVLSGTSGWADIYDDAVYSGSTTQQLALVDVPLSYNGNQYRLALKASCATVYTNPATLTVNPNPVVNFSSDIIVVCGNEARVIDPMPSGGSGKWKQHVWSGDIGSLNNYFIQSPTFKSLIATNYNLNYKVTDTNGCTGNGSVTIRVDYPDATFDQDQDHICTPDTVNFSKDMTDIDRFSWDFGDGSPVNTTDANPSHIFTNSAPSSIAYYNVTLSVWSSGGCKASYTRMVTVYPSVDATFTAVPSVVCSGSLVTFTANPGAIGYSWDYGDGAAGPGGAVSTHLYTTSKEIPVVYKVMLTTTSFYSCTSIKTTDIKVMPKPVPEFTANPASQVYSASGNSVSFVNGTNKGTWDYTWRFGDGGTSSDSIPVHIYSSIGQFNVTLIVSNSNCTDSIRHVVSIIPPAPLAMFDTIPSGCAPLFISIRNTTINGDVPGTTYYWDFGDGSTSTAKNPTYTYFTPGDYTVRLIVVGPGGTSDYSRAVRAYPSPKAYFEVTPSKVYVNDENVRCFNLSQGASSFLWEFGDGDTTSIREPFHKYMTEGVYDITLTAYSTNGCSDKYILSPAVTVIPIGELRYPSVFRPNATGPIERTDLPTGGDEVDQFFFPPIRQKVITYKLQIFNRWGVLIFESHDINKPWNGYYQGKLCPEGVYVWLVEGKYEDGKPYKMAGNITLLQ